MTEPRSTYQYAVRYRRVGWKSEQVRFYQSRWFAMRHVRKLQRGSWDYAPITILRVERRELGPVETVWDLEEDT